MAERHDTSPPPRERAPFGRYLLEELLARGGMGEVFRAVAVGAGGFRKPVVVKRILPGLGGMGSVSEMFIEEARLMSRLLHPNIVQVIDFGQGEDADYFLVMELVDGVDLRAFGKWFADHGQAIPLGLCAHIALQVLRGLGHAHTKAYGDGRSLVHRDVSPGNVLLSRVGEVKVADFGVALVAQPGATGEPRTLAGKPGFMAPEQLFGQPVDARADVFSVGVVLAHLLIGDTPFHGETAVEQQASANLGRLRDLEALRPDLTEELARVVRQALTPEPGDRFPSARAMAKAVETACSDGGVTIASADELAEHVERVAEGRARGRRVLALGADLVRRELTRTGASTMRVTTATRSDVTSHSTWVERPSARGPEGAPPDERLDALPAPPSTAPSGPPSAAAPPAKGRVWRTVVLALTLAVGVAGATWLARASLAASRTSEVPLGTTSTPHKDEASASHAGGEPAPDPEPVPPPEPAPTASTEALEDAPPPRAPKPPPMSLSSPSVAAPVPPRPPPPPVATCQGSVLLSGKGSWWVNGGPSGRVQAPGTYTWPCGGYSLTGTSRMDGRVVSRGVTVQQGGTATARFE